MYTYIHKLCKTCKSVNPTRIRVILDLHKDTSLDITRHFWIPKLSDAPRCTGASKSPVPLLPLLPLLPWPSTFAARWNSSLEIGRDLLMTHIYIYIIHLFIDLSSSNSRVIMYNIYIYIYTANAWVLPGPAMTTGDASSSSSFSSSSSSSSTSSTS